MGLLLDLIKVYILLILLSSCGSKISKPEIIHFSPNSISSYSPSNTSVISRMVNGKEIICLMPAPDVEESISKNIDLDIQLVAYGQPEEEKANTKSGKAESELAGRSPAILFSRELIYRACEFSMNYNLNKEEATKIYQQNLKIIHQVMMKEASNTKVILSEENSSNDLNNPNGDNSSEDTTDDDT